MTARARNRCLEAFLARPLLFVFFQSMVRTLFRPQGKIGKRLAAQGRKDEENYQERQKQSCPSNTTNAPPAHLVGS